MSKYIREALSRPMAVSNCCTRTTRILYSVAYTILHPNWQLTRSVPLKATIIWRQVKVPIRQSATTGNLRPEIITIGAQLVVCPALATDLEEVVEELVRYIAIVSFGD